MCFVSTDDANNLHTLQKLKVKHHKAIYYHGHKFCIKWLDDTKKTCDSGITAVFEVTNISSRNDIHPQNYQNQYYGILDDIIECDFSHLQSSFIRRQMIQVTTKSK